MLRPRFVSENVVVSVDDGLIVDGGRMLRRLSGETAQRVIPTLLRLLDGTRTISEVERMCSAVSPRHVRDAIATLTDYGLVEDDLGDISNERIQRDVLAYCRRFAGETGVNRSGMAAYERLARAHICVVRQAPRIDDQIVSLLEESAIGRVETVNLGEVSEVGARRDTDRLVLISAAPRDDDDEFHTLLGRICDQHGITWLRATADAKQGYAEIGPLFRAGQYPCFQCFQKTHGLPSQGAQNSQAGTSLDPAAQAMWCGMVALELIAIVSRLGPRVSEQGLLRYELTTWRGKELRSFRVPGCRACGLAAAGVKPDSDRCASAVDLALAFEDAVSLESRDNVDPRVYRERARLGELLSRHTKQLMAYPRCELGKPVAAACGVLEALGRDSVSDRRRCTRDELATLLLKVAGIQRATPSGVKRWSATAGNLGSVELFAAVRDVDGVPQGEHFYQAGDHSLASLSAHGTEVTADAFFESLLNAATWRRQPGAVVMFTAALHRLAQKYGAFGYRLANLDAGVAISQMQIIAAALGLRADPIRAWPDDVAKERLNLEPRDEFVTAVVAIHACNPVVHSGAKVEFRKEAPASLKPLEFFSDLSLAELTDVLIDESTRRYCAIYAPCDDQRHQGVPEVGLPAPLSGGRTIEDVLSQRMSVRRYAPSAISAEQLATMVHHARRGAYELRWAGLREFWRALEVVVIVRRVAGIEPGVYVYDTHAHGLIRIRQKLHQSELEQLYVESEFSHAAAQVWICGNLAAVCERHGAWGHRQLLVCAGAAVHRASFAGMATGLVGSIAAGLVRGGARRHIGLDGYSRAPLVGFMAGNARN